MGANRQLRLTGRGEIVFGDGAALTTTLRGASGLAGALTFTLPATDGNANEIPITDGSGALSFVALTLQRAYDGAEDLAMGAGKTITISQANNEPMLVLSKTATASGRVIDIDNDGTQESLRIEQDGAGNAVLIQQDGLGTALTISQLGNAVAFALTQAANQIGLDLIKTGVGGSDAVSIENDGTGRGLFINQDGAATALRIDQDGGATALLINQATNNTGINLFKSGTGAGVALLIENDGTGIGISLIQDGAAVGLNIDQNGAAAGAVIDVSVTQNALQLVQSTAGNATALLDFDHNGTSLLSIDIDGSDSTWQITRGGLVLAGHLEYQQQTYTIATGAITIFGTDENGLLLVDTEAAAASDDLDTITLDHVTANGRPIIILRAANGARTVVVRHGVGNIFLDAGANKSLDDTPDTLTLMWDGTRWLQISFSNNG